MDLCCAISGLCFRFVGVYCGYLGDVRRKDHDQHPVALWTNRPHPQNHRTPRGRSTIRRAITPIVKTIPTMVDTC